jgi:putative ribosome biogenesis GTPase RsgA
MHVDVSALSEDELHTVLSFLDLYSLLTLTKSAKKWRVTALAKEDRYWQSIYSKYHIIQPEEKSYYDALHYKTLTKNWRGKNDLLTTNIGAKQKNKTYVKCVLLGNSGVGRTSLCFMLGGGLEVMNQAYTAPPHMAYDSDSCKTVLVGDTYVNVNFWGSSRFTSNL